MADIQKLEQYQIHDIIDRISKRHEEVVSEINSWKGERLDEDGYYVPECSYLGNSLICLSHDYEGDDKDCMFLRHAHSDIKFLLEYIKVLESNLEGVI